MNYYSNNAYFKSLPLLNTYSNGVVTPVNASQPIVTVSPLPGNVKVSNSNSQTANSCPTSNNPPMTTPTGTPGSVALITYTALPNTIMTLSSNSNYPNPIPDGSTSIPPGTVSVISNYSSIPLVSFGGIGYNSTTNNGKITIPCSGIYIITCTASYPANANGTRSLYLYQISGSSGVIFLRGVDSKNAVGDGQATSLNISSVIYLCAGDQIFLAGSQISDQNSMDMTSGTQLGIILLTSYSI
jgi:hypothetical protein